MWQPVFLWESAVRSVKKSERKEGTRIACAHFFIFEQLIE